MEVITRASKWVVGGQQIYSGLPLQFGLLPRTLWSLAVYEMPISTTEKLERTVTGYINKWLRVARCLTIGLYGDSVLRLPLISLTEEFKCMKARH